MAKKPKETETVAKRDTKLTSGATLKSLLKSGRTMKENVDELTTAHATEVREAVDKKFLHKKAFGTIKQLDRLSPEKLADFMEHFDHYFEASGLEERANSAQRLPMGAGEQGEQEPPKDNVRNIAEKAGAGLPN
jgi:hypothetical protein